MEPLDSSNHTNGATMEHVDGNEDANRVTMESADDSEDVDSIENRICSSLLILKKFDVWPCRTAKEFTLWQSIIHVPFLKFPGDRIYFYDLYQDSTLPFDLYELQETGGYGSVRKVTIHPSHYNCHGNSKVILDPLLAFINRSLYSQQVFAFVQRLT
ncbi:hypothetical protein NW754_007132 [Fusarium falciforme]|nr:hypothetical protein NW754_007132 [Fusarium falciforme]